MFTLKKKVANRMASLFPCNTRILQSVEVYNPASDSWVMYRNLPLPLMGCGVAFLSGMVYVVGGVTTKKQVFTGMVPAEVLSTVYATDPNERTSVVPLIILGNDHLIRCEWREVPLCRVKKENR